MGSNANHIPQLQYPGILSILRKTWDRSRGTISLWSVWACVGIFLMAAILDLTRVISRQWTIAFLGLSHTGAFRRLWLHQFVAAPLLHGGVTHLLFSMLALWMLGPAVEKALGRGRYVLLSALCATSSMLGFLLLDWGAGHVVLGYSGVIFGILVAQAILFPNSIIAIFAFFPLKMKHAVLLLGTVELYLTLSPEEAGIAHAAHLSGAVAAAVCLLGGKALRAMRGRAQVRTRKAASRQRACKAGRGVPDEL